MNKHTLSLKEVAKVIRSKNAGPFELTFDIIFSKKEQFEVVRNAQLFNRKMIADLYGVKQEDIIHVIHFEPAYAIKIAMRRKIPSGCVGDRDVYGAQQHAPLLDVRIPIQK